MMDFIRNTRRCASLPALLSTTLVGLVALSIGPACAEEPEAPGPAMAAPLSKSEVESLIAGKKITYLRKRDGARVGWDFRGGEEVYFSTSGTQRNALVAGTYKITNDGAVCFKWNADKFMTMQDGCVRFRRSADTLHVVGYREPDRVAGDVVPD